MKINTLPQEFIGAQPILKILTRAGFEAYFVGGSVRDMLLSQVIHDVDIASSAFPEEVKFLFEKTVDTGIQHGTVMVLDHGEGYEITTFRTESTYTDFRRPDSVTFVRSLSEDLKRRDFTINALAMTLDGEIVDLFGGLDDIKNGIIRAVGDAETRFTEDALRMMRALRFSAQLGFIIEADTQKALIELVPNLEKIAVERIRVEFEKMLMGASAANSLKIAVQDKVMLYLPGHIGQWELSLIISDLGIYQANHIVVVWCHLLTRSPLKIQEMTHFMRQWKLSRDIMKTVIAVVPIVRQIENVTILDLYTVYSYADVLLEILKITDVADKTIQHVRSILKMLPITQSSELAINGSDLIKLGIVQPGPRMGHALKAMEKAVVLSEVSNTPEALTSFAKEQFSHDKN
ncbi:CCA tRNA nucleotidyltransferase [Leuconostoc carnosum]|uniref:CCA tRNA nucleotidyltransferase n=1 Tax=Leuconostoc carnosum TaxID=1252 RepID=UPI00123A96DC|nr:CCA tRNA nucleotidyltransferase [Leuconostoc carnosum]KAA8370970.1 CCA tRNA nucleotidyltransferase [Leuconostoc carnosum]KAA8382614.1 CCA tRNA nucleotidyltransferase [Leuconostoc carnosum]